MFRNCLFRLLKWKIPKQKVVKWQKFGQSGHPDAKVLLVVRGPWIIDTTREIIKRRAHTKCQMSSEEYIFIAQNNSFCKLSSSHTVQTQTADIILLAKLSWAQQSLAWTMFMEVRYSKCKKWRHSGSCLAGQKWCQAPTESSTGVPPNQKK